VLSLEEAKERLLASIQPLKAGRYLLSAAYRLYAAAQETSAYDLPHFDNSAMDGYAVRAADLAQASESSPVFLKQVGRIGAGELFTGTIAPGECVRIFTGSALPSGADAVVMQEDVTTEGDQVRFVEAARPFENVRLKGEDVRAGSILIRPGDRLDATRLGLLAATGHAEVEAYPQPKVALLGTGSELVEPREGIGLPAGKIFESNLTMLGGLLRDLNIAAVSREIIGDDLERTVSILKAAFTNDFVITTGGVSVGEFDFVKEAFTRLGGKIDLWRIALRPGKPFVHGTLGGKHLFGLPGNPVSALVTFLLLVRPALLKAMGARNLELPRVEGALTEAITNRGDRRHFVRARWENGKVQVAGPQSSHMIGTLGDANCLIDVAPLSELAAGARVPALLWQFPES
jgi:molybdopterin molybdotransferase